MRSSQQQLPAGQGKGPGWGHLDDLSENTWEQDPENSSKSLKGTLGVEGVGGEGELFLAILLIRSLS